MTHLEILTRCGCHLCDEMETLVAGAAAAGGFTYGSTDIDTDPDLAARYGDVVPVLLRDGRPVAKVRVSAADLDRIVARRRV